MPRLSPELLWRAQRHDALLPLLLRECRDLPSARNELRWLRSHALAEFSDPGNRQKRDATRNCPSSGWRTRLKSMCEERSRGKPLQYILGDQPFGDLEILCRKGVLIPRAETETYTIRASQLIVNHIRQKSSSEAPTRLAVEPLRVLDLCTGTGCIPLLLHQLLSPHIPHLEVVGVDISQKAVTLARKNLEHNIHLGLLSRRAKSEVRFLHGDILENISEYASLGAILSSEKQKDHCQAEGEKANDLPRPSKGRSWDIIISNPPYISPTQFGNGTTARSVRSYEPKLALVPPAAIAKGGKKLKEASRNPCSTTEVNPETGLDTRADTFYPRLISISSFANAKLSIFECGDPQQAMRVAGLARNYWTTQCSEGGSRVEVWRLNNELGQDELGGSHLASVQDDKGARAVVLKRRPF